MAGRYGWCVQPLNSLAAADGIPSQHPALKHCQVSWVHGGSLHVIIIIKSMYVFVACERGEYMLLCGLGFVFIYFFSFTVLRSY